MSKATAVVSFSSSSGANRVDFKLTQRPWKKADIAQFAEWLRKKGVSPQGADLFLAYHQYLSQCDENGNLTPTLLVRLSDLAIPYALRASHGTISAAKLITEQRREFLAFRLVTEMSIDFGTIISCEWNGQVWDAAGNIIDDPVYTISGQKISLAAPAYGVLEVLVEESMYEHNMVISPRDPTATQALSSTIDIEELYNSTVWIFCNNDVDLVDINMPDNFGTCGGASGGEAGEGEGEEEGGLNDITFEVFDYCTGDPIPNAEITVIVNDPDGGGVFYTSAGGTLQLPPGTHDIVVVADGYTTSNEDNLKENDSFTIGITPDPAAEEEEL